MRRIAVLDAPSNLGLRPPTATSVPGCAKAPGALRDHGLLRRLNARDAGCLTPPRYDPGDWRPGDGVCHAPEISAYSRKLADRIGAILDQGEFPVVLGGDCSIVLGSALAMHRLGEAVGGRIGLVFVDGHSDFRHPGNASYVGAAAGEDLALVTGRGQTDLAAMEGRRPYYRDIDVVVMGIRAQDEYRLDLQAAGIVTRPVPTLRVEGAARSAQWARDQLVDCAGYWVHIDMDVLDPAVMPAVDAPEPGGIAFPELEILLAGLVESPHCLGVEITVFDPDYDPDGRYAEEITSAIVAGLKPAQLVDARPDLIAARRDLAGPGRLGPGRPGPGQRGNPAAGQRGDSPAGRPGDSVVGRLGEPAAMSAAQPVSEPDADATADAAADRAERDAASDRSEFDALSRRAEVQDAFRDDEPDVLSHEVGFADASREDEPAALPGDDSSFEAAGDHLLGRATDVEPGAADHPSPDQTFDAVDASDTALADDPRLDAVGSPGMVSVDGSVSDAVDGPGAAPVDGPGAVLVDGPGAVLVDDPARALMRPLGSAPLLDSKPLPATMPGMLRPRSVEDFTLPAQRPAFEAGPEQPADLG